MNNNTLYDYRYGMEKDYKRYSYLVSLLKNSDFVKFLGEPKVIQGIDKGFKRSVSVVFTKENNGIHVDLFKVALKTLSSDEQDALYQLITGSDRDLLSLDESVNPFKKDWVLVHNVIIEILSTKFSSLDEVLVYLVKTIIKYESGILRLHPSTISLDDVIQILALVDEKNKKKLIENIIFVSRFDNFSLEEKLELIKLPNDYFLSLCLISNTDVEFYSFYCAGAGRRQISKNDFALKNT